MPPPRRARPGSRCTGARRRSSTAAIADWDDDRPARRGARALRRPGARQRRHLDPPARHAGWSSRPVPQASSWAAGASAGRGCSASSRRRSPGRDVPGRPGPARGGRDDAPPRRAARARCSATDNGPARLPQAHRVVPQGLRRTPRDPPGRSRWRARLEEIDALLGTARPRPAVARRGLRGPARSHPAGQARGAAATAGSTTPTTSRGSSTTSPRPSSPSPAADPGGGGLGALG